MLNIGACDFSVQDAAKNGTSVTVDQKLSHARNYANRLTTLFHRRTQQQVCNKVVIIKDQRCRYTTL